MTAREMAWLKAVPSAMAEGFTGGRSDVKVIKDSYVLTIGKTSCFSGIQRGTD